MKLKRRIKRRKKKLKYYWQEHLVKITEQSQVKLRQTPNQDTFELSITSNGYQWNTVILNPEQVIQAYKLMQHLYIYIGKRGSKHG